MTLTAAFMPQTLTVSIEAGKMSAAVQPPIVKEYIDTETYMGPYEVTPSENTQILYTENKRMSQAVTVNPIPSNWGKISWNGSVLTVS